MFKDETTIQNRNLNTQWPEAMKHSLDVYKAAEIKLRKAVDENMRDEGTEIAEEVIRGFIDLLKVSCDMFDNYKDCIKDAYCVIDEMIYYVALSYEEQKENDKQKSNLEERYNILRDSLNILIEKTNSYERKIDMIVAKSETEDIPPEVETLCVKDMNELTEIRNGLFVYCAEIIDYIGQVKERVNKYQSYMLDEDDESSLDNGSEFLS